MQRQRQLLGESLARTPTADKELKGVGDKMNAENPEEFTKRELWEMTFGPGGAVPTLYKKMNELCKSIDQLTNDITHVRRDMKEYNGLQTKQRKLEEEVKACKEILEEEKIKATTEEEVLARIDAEKEKERQRAMDEQREADAAFGRRMNTLKVIFALISLLLVMGGIFIW